MAVLCAITWKSSARGTIGPEIYSTLTTDTIRPVKKDSPAPSVADTLPPRLPGNRQDTVPTLRDSISRTDTVPLPQIDTFTFRLSKDTLDAPVHYAAEDSAVVLVDEKKIILYGKTKTTYNDINLEAPKVALDQQTSIVTAYGEKDSLGNVLQRASFEQGENQFQSEFIEFNFKTQKGLTQNTFTQQSEMYVMGEAIKKVNANTFFVRRGRFTTCNLDDPHFAFVANKIKVINNKVAVSGPTHPEFESVPVPLYLPFGYFPMNRGRHSGFLPPQFTANEDFGLGLEGFGYYKVLSDYIDVTLRGSVYSYGGWNATFTPTYRKRYRYNGSMNLNIQHTKFNFKGDPDYNLVKTFFITWNHSVDQRARPGTSFSASVNAGSTKFNEYIPNNPNRNFQNNLSSSINYSKTWANKPYNLSLSANHNQNSVSRLVILSLPDAGFNVSTIYPFQRKEMVGSPRWYEKLGIGYNGVLRNSIPFYDTAEITVAKLLDTLQWGVQHRVPITLSLPPLGPFMVAPSFNYEETWLTQRMIRKWNSTKGSVDTVSTDKGIFTDRQITVGLGFSTALYGTRNFGTTGLTRIRHVMRPSFAFAYKPNLSRSNFDVIQINQQGTVMPVPRLSSTMFSPYAYGKYAGISFTLDNNLEAKWRGKKDTSEKKVRLIDGFGFSTSYNFLADNIMTPRLQPLAVYLRSTLFEKINLTASTTLDPYAEGLNGVPNYGRFVWQDGRFSPGRLSNGSISLSTDFRSKPRDPEKAQETPSDQQQITDPMLLGDQQMLMDYMRRNPAEFVDFNIPWSINIAYSLFFNRQLKPDYSGYETNFSSNLSFNGSFSLTPKWNFSANGYYDLGEMMLQTFTLSINREMHCWQMSIGVTPVGQYRFFNITISPKASMLQDLRINRTRTFYNY